MSAPLAVDVHAHASTEPFSALVGGYEGRDEVMLAARERHLAQVERFPLLSSGWDRRVQLMEEVGVGRQLLSAGTPRPFPGRQLRVEIVQAWNDGADELARRYPGRFSVFASVPLPFVDAAIEETRRIAARPTTTGVTVSTHTAGMAIDDPAWEALYEVWNELGLTVFLHPDGFCVRGLLADYGMDIDIGTQFDDVIASVRLINSLIPERFPDVSWIVPHLGGALPFLLTRLDQHWWNSRQQRPLSARPSESLRGLYFDTAGHGAAPIRYALDHLGSRRVLFGSDFPMLGEDCLSLAMRSLLDGTTAEERGAVLEANAAGLTAKSRA